MKKTYQAGLYAEGIVKRAYQKNGFKIISHRYNCRHGEIDLIAIKKQKMLTNNLFFKNSKHETINFIEVKFRKSEEMIESILRSNQIIRIKNAASHFLSENRQFLNHDISFDFVTVNANLEVKIHKDYF